MSRSYLYVPGDREDRLVKAADRGADAVLLDLEDAVAPAAKPAARETVVRFLASNPPAADYWVRVNNDHNLPADVSAVAALPIAGVCLPKASSDSLVDLDDLLVAGGAGPDIPVVALVETAEGVLEAASLARSARVSHLALGEADLGAELGVSPSAADRVMMPLRMQIVVASAAAGLDPPTGPVSTQWSDLEELRRSTEALAEMGFGSRAAIHPAQVAVINEVFTPTAEELDRAQQLIDDYDVATASGDGAIVGRDGTMVDEAVVRAARRVVENARRNR